MDTDTLRRLHYLAAIACGIFAALLMHIVLTLFGAGLDAALRADAGGRQQFISAVAWWAVAAAGLAGGWATGAYLIAAAREREFLFRLAQRFLIALVFVAASVGGIMSKSGNLGYRRRDCRPDRARPRRGLRLLRGAARLSQRRAGLNRRERRMKRACG